ncbi:MAG TPA: tRNA (adenosine(37)-N6)-threonylcarbamoyltransferase complex dimerization subunit type 1 TsaB [Rubrivivax sp.]
MAKLARMTATLLAFDTSTESMAVALQSARGTSAWNGPGGALASATLLPTVRSLLREQALALSDLDAIAFGAGPGAFTGLRTACAVAQGLAFGVGRPVLPIDSLLIVAEDARSQHGEAAGLDIGVAMDARMGELYAARYHWEGSRWRVLCASMLCRPEKLMALWGAGAPAVLAGNGLPLLPAPFCIAAASALAPAADRARALLRLAQMLYADGAGVPAAQALPLYLRDKVALTTHERAALKVAL